MEADDADGIYRDLCDFALVILGMSLGYPVKRKSIRGSCGGISALGLEKVCDCRNRATRVKRLAREAQRQQRRIL